MTDRTGTTPPHPSQWSRPADVELAEVSGCPLVVRVVGHFDLIRAGASVAPGGSVRRLLALLAVEDRPLGRGYIAARLWPDVPSTRAQANLRSAVWRMQQHCPEAVTVSAGELRLASAAITDIRIVRGVVIWLLDRSRATTQTRLSLAVRTNLREDLLADWYDDEWVTAERERFQQLRVHALETLAERLVSAGWYGAGVDAAMAAVQCDAYRESAHAALVAAYLAEGNYCEARRRVDHFRSLLREELGMEPSREFMALLDIKPGYHANRRDRRTRPQGWCPGMS